MDITSFVVSVPVDATSPSLSSTLRDSGWFAQTLDETSWEEPMGGNASLATWHQYTGLAFQTWVPPTPMTLPQPMMGYYLDYTLSEGRVFPPHR
jgi:hypothetical protein